MELHQGLVWLDSGLILNSMGPWKGSAPDPGGFMERAIAAAQAQVHWIVALILSFLPDALDCSTFCKIMNVDLFVEATCTL